MEVMMSAEEWNFTGVGQNAIYRFSERKQQELQTYRSMEDRILVATTSMFWKEFWATSSAIVKKRKNMSLSSLEPKTLLFLTYILSSRKDDITPLISFPKVVVSDKDKPLENARLHDSCKNFTVVGKGGRARYLFAFWKGIKEILGRNDNIAKIAALQPHKGDHTCRIGNEEIKSRCEDNHL